MKIYIDIDDTICRTSGLDYSNSTPLKERIEKINDLYRQGNTIIYWTARGSETGIDWKDITEKQLNNWGALHHSLLFKKPAYDLFICDKAINSEHFFSKSE
jgi:uncharacterized protein YheU (UPF0270 family)